MAEQRDYFNLRKVLSERGLTPLQIIGDPNSQEGARGVRPGSKWDPSYDELRRFAIEYLSGVSSENFPQGLRSGGVFQLKDQPAATIKDVNVTLGEDGFPSFSGITYEDAQGKRWTTAIGIDEEGNPNPEKSITFPSRDNRGQGRPLPELRARQDYVASPVTGLTSTPWMTGTTPSTVMPEAVHNAKEFLFGPSQQGVLQQSKPTPAHWSDNQVQSYHQTGMLPAAAFAGQPGSTNPTWDDVFYSKITPERNQNGQIVGYHMPGEPKAPMQYKPWVDESTIGHQAHKMDGALGLAGYLTNPFTMAKDVMQNMPYGGETIANRTAGLLGLEQRQPGFGGMPRIGEGQVTPQHELFAKQLIGKDDGSLATAGKVGYNLLTGVANVGYSLPEFFYSPLGRATKAVGKYAASTQAAIPAAWEKGAAEGAAAIDKARLAALADTGFQGMFLKDMGTATYDTAKNMYGMFEQGQTANAVSQMADLFANLYFTTGIAKHAAGNVPLLGEKGMRVRAADIASQQDAMRADMTLANTPFMSKNADFNISLNDNIGQRSVYSMPGQQPSVPLDETTYGLKYRADKLDLKDLLKEEGQPVAPQKPPFVPVRDKWATVSEETQQELIIEAARKRAIEEMEAKGFTGDKGMAIADEVARALELDRVRREKLRQETGHSYLPGELLAARGTPAGGLPIVRPGEVASMSTPGATEAKPNMGANPEFVRRVAEEAKRGRPGIDPKTGQPMAPMPNVPPSVFDVRGPASLSEVAKNVPERGVEAGLNVESQRGPDEASARTFELHTALTSGPAFRTLVDTAAKELGLTAGMRESTDTGYWMGTDNAGNKYVQMNPASAFRFQVPQGADLNDYSRRLGQFATALSYAQGQEAAAWNIIRHDVVPDRFGRYVDENNVQRDMHTGVQIERGRTFNKPEVEAMSQEVVRILRDEFGIKTQGDNIGIQGYDNGLRLFDFDGAVQDKMLLAKAAQIAYQRTVGRESGHKAGVRLIAYESNYEQQQGWGSGPGEAKPEFKPGTFGGRYSQLLGVGTDVGISPGLRRAIDNAAAERNQRTAFYSGLGSRGRGIDVHPQTGQPIAGGDTVRATPLALTGDQQLSLPPRPVIPTPATSGGVNFADRIPRLADAGKAQVSLPGRDKSRAAIRKPLENQSQVDVGSLTGLGDETGRPMGGDRSTAQSLNLRQTIERIRKQDNVDLSVDVFNQSGYSVVRVLGKGRDGNTYEVSKVSGEIIRDDKVDGPVMYLSSFSTKTGMEGKGILQGVLSEFIHRANNEASAAGLKKLNYRLLDVSREGKSTRALGNVAGPENTTVDSIAGREEKYPAWRARLEENRKTSKQYQAEFEALSLLAEKNDADYDAGKIKVEEYLAESRRIQDELEKFDNRAGNHEEATLKRPSYGANAVSMLGNRSLGGEGDKRSVEDRLAEAYAEVRRLEDERDSGRRNPRRVQMDIDALEDTINDLHAQQDAEAKLRSNPNQARLLPPRAEVELMNLRRLMRDVSDGKVSTGMAAESIQRSIDKLVDRTTLTKEMGMAELGKIEGIDPAFLNIASRRFDERDAAKNAPKAEPVKGGTTGRDRVRDPLAKPQVWERRKERTGPEALAETGDPSRLTYDELVDLQTRLERNKGSADPDLLRAVTEEMQNRHRQYGNEGERNTALGGFVPETTPKSQLNDMVRTLPDQIRSDRERLSELNKRDGRNRSPEAAQLATEIKVNEERLRAAKVELNARGRQQGNWERLDRTRIVQRERDKQTFETPGVEPPRVKRDPVQALNWARGRFDRLTIDELMQARDALKQQGRPYWKEVEKAINERRKAMPEMRREEGRPTDVVPENMTRSELESEVDRLAVEVEANDARVAEMQAAGASPAEIEAVRAEADVQRGTLSELESELANRDRIETTDFRRENEKQIGGHQQFTNQMARRASKGGKWEVVKPTEGPKNESGQFWEEEARYYGLSAGVRDVVNLTFKGNSNVKEVLERIVKNFKSKNMQGIDPELGKLAEFLLKNQDYKSLNVVVGAWGKNSGEASGYNPGWRSEAPTLQGGTKYGSIKFSREQLSNPARALEIVMHEIVHSATADKVNRAIFGTIGVATGRDSDIMGSSGTRYYDRLRAYVNNANSDKAVRKLVQTYLKVLSLQTDNSKAFSMDKLNALRDEDTSARKNVFGAGSDMDRLAADGQYQIADLNEFIAAATTNPEFKAYLKAIKMGETNAWSRFKQAVKEIMGIEGDTALDHAMESILEISSRDTSSFAKPDNAYYDRLFELRTQRFMDRGMSQADAEAAAMAEIHPKGFDRFGIGKQSITRGIKDAEADTEELSKKGRKSGYTTEDVKEMNELIDEHLTKHEDFDKKAENSPEFQRAQADLQAELGREPTYDEVIQEMDFRENSTDPENYNYRQYERDRRRETRGKSEQELMDRLRQEPGMEDKLPPMEEPLDAELEAEIAREAATSMGLEGDMLESLGIVTRDERRSAGEFAPGSVERRDELYQSFVELGGDTDVRNSSEIPSDVQRAFKELHGFEYKPEDVETLGEPRLGNRDIKGLGNEYSMSGNKSFLREEAQASVNVVKKGIEGLKRAKNDITDKETFTQLGIDAATASFLRSSQAQLDVLASRTKSKTLRKVSELLNSSMPGRTDKPVSLGFHTAVSRTQLQFKNQLADALRPFESELKLKDVDGQKQFLEDLGRAMVQPGLPSDPKLAKAVTELRGLYKRMYYHQVRSGVKLENAGENYVPRMLDNEKVLSDRFGFLNAAQKAYETTGMDPVEAREAAATWYDAILRGDSGFSYDQKFVFDSSNLNGEPKHTRSRKFNKVAESFMEPYYNRNILDATLSYVGRAVKNSEIARRFGADFELYQGFEKDLIDEGNRTVLKDMNNLVASQLGTNQLKDYKGQGIINFLNAYSAIHFLPRATLSSVAEPLVTGMRTGNMMDSMSALGNSMVYMKRKLMNQDPDYYQKLAQDVGVVVSELSSQALSSSVDSRYWTDQTSSASRYLTTQFFRKTGLHQWTEGTRIASVRAGTVFLRRLAEDINSNGRMKASSARYLNELGVSDHASFAKFVLQLEKLDEAGRLSLINRSNGKGPQMYRDALARFAEQVIMNPNAGTRPRWANHPLGSVIFNLQSYLYAFHENVTKRAFRLAKTAVSKNELKAMDRMHMLGPAMMLPVLTGVQYLIGKPRDEAFKDPSRVNEEPMSFGMEVARAMSRSNLFGRYDFAVNAALGARYEKEPATVMIGPVLGTMSEGFKAGVEYFGDKNSPNTNTAERRAARMAYDLTIQPAANAAFSLGPGKILGGLGAAGIQTVSHPATREAFVERMAGPPVAPKKRPERVGNLIDELFE